MDLEVLLVPADLVDHHRALGVLPVLAVPLALAVQALPDPVVPVVRLYQEDLGDLVGPAALPDPVVPVVPAVPAVLVVPVVPAVLVDLAGQEVQENREDREAQG